MESLSLSEFISEEDINQFRTDAQENLDDLEDALLQLEAAPRDKELIGRVFRAMHTIKGTSSMYGFEEASRFTHQIENFYDVVRNGKAVLTKEVIDLTLAARDQLLAMIFGDGPVKGDRGEQKRIADAFSGLLRPNRGSGGEVVSRSTPVSVDEPARPVCRNVRFRFRVDDPIFQRATNPLVYLRALKQLGTCRVTCHDERVPPLEEIDPTVCYFSWDVGLVSDCSDDDIRGEFMFIEDELEELAIHVLPEPEAGDSLSEIEPSVPRLGDILLERGDISREALAEALSKKPRLGETLVSEGYLPESRVQSALQQQKMVRQMAEGGRRENSVSSVRVASDKLDELINQVGELVIVQARLRQVIAHCGEVPELTTVSEEITRLTENLRDSTMGIRMLPIDTLFGRFNRLVRDLSRELGKEIRLVTEGGDTELDKTVIENLNDPLVHILRNSMDHGIETPDERRRKGKTPTGTIRLSAIHSGASVLIRVEDDGRGIDRQRILAKAIERGLAPSGAVLSDEEVVNLLFAPGFSTASTVTSVSGRGVGMDVVKKTIEGIRGSVEIVDRKDQGITIDIRLPLTLAIIDGFLVQSGGDQFVLPLSTVKECVKLTRKEIADNHGRQIINIRNEVVPYIRLRDVFHLDGGPLSQEQVVITEVDRDRVGMVVDRVIGQSQVVIKSLGDLFSNVAEFSGATILGDGRVVPILDVARIIETARAQARNQGTQH
ncbi:MAG: chemotaxis protein CheA [Magnetococcales bacterium]|nr:chemotaxis protein CheA [Magnetococcales bacterium]